MYLTFWPNEDFPSQDPPLVTEQRDSSGNVTYQGYVMEMVDYMAKAFNTTVNHVIHLQRAALICFFF